MVVVALLSVDLVESVDLVSVELVVNCTCVIQKIPDSIQFAPLLGDSQTHLSSCLPKMKS